MNKKLINVVATALVDFWDEMQNLPSSIVHDRAQICAANIIKMVEDPQTVGMTRQSQGVKEEW